AADTLQTVRSACPHSVMGTDLLAVCLWVLRRTEELTHLAVNTAAVLRGPPKDSKGATQPLSLTPAATLSPEPYIARALVMSLACNHQKAEEMLSVALRLAPRKSLYWQLLGQEQQDAKRPSGQALHTAVALSPFAVGAIASLSVDNPEQTMVYAQLAAARGTFRGFLQLGITYRFKNEHDLALACLTKAVALRPRSSTALIHYGACLNQITPPRLKEALAALTEAVNVDPTNSYAHCVLSMSLLESGDRTAAFRHIEIADVLDPDSNAVAECREVLFKRRDE
ncbi:hypothetical protein KIPB_011181, partial [Kipferlia bialata]